VQLGHEPVAEPGERRAAPARVRTRWAVTGSAAVPNSSRSPPAQKSGPAAAAVEPVPVGSPGRGGNRCDAAEHGEGRLGVQSVGVLSGGDQQLAGDVGPDAGAGRQVGVDRGDQRADERVEVVDLLAQGGVAAGQRAQRGLGGLLRVADAGGIRAQSGASGDQPGVLQAAQLDAQRLGSGDDQRLDPPLAVRPLIDGAAAGHSQVAQRLHLPAAVLRSAGAHPGQSGAGGGLGIQRIGLAGEPTGLAVGSVDLDHCHVLGGQVTG
jgi:hypothetical protein